MDYNTHSVMTPTNERCIQLEESFTLWDETVVENMAATGLTKEKTTDDLGVESAGIQPDLTEKLGVTLFWNS
jgi:hypothetical protein